MSYPEMFLSGSRPEPERLSSTFIGSCQREKHEKSSLAVYIPYLSYLYK